MTLLYADRYLKLVHFAESNSLNPLDLTIAEAAAIIDDPNSLSDAEVQIIADRLPEKYRTKEIKGINRFRLNRDALEKYFNRRIQEFTAASFSKIVWNAKGSISPEMYCNEGKVTSGMTDIEGPVKKMLEDYLDAASWPTEWCYMHEPASGIIPGIHFAHHSGSILETHQVPQFELSTSSDSFRMSTWVYRPAKRYFKYDRKNYMMLKLKKRKLLIYEAIGMRRLRYKDAKGVVKEKSITNISSVSELREYIETFVSSMISLKIMDFSHRDLVGPVSVREFKAYLKENKHSDYPFQSVKTKHGYVVANLSHGGGLLLHTQQAYKKFTRRTKVPTPIVDTKNRYPTVQQLINGYRDAIKLPSGEWDLPYLKVDGHNYRVGDTFMFFRFCN